MEVRPNDLLLVAGPLADRHLPAGQDVERVTRRALPHYHLQEQCLLKQVNIEPSLHGH